MHVEAKIVLIVSGVDGSVESAEDVASKLRSIKWRICVQRRLTPELSRTAARHGGVVNATT